MYTFSKHLITRGMMRRIARTRVDNKGEDEENKGGDEEDNLCFIDLALYVFVLELLLLLLLLVVLLLLLLLLISVLFYQVQMVNA